MANRAASVALERIESGGAKDRTEGLNDLKRIFRSNNHGNALASVGGLPPQDLLDRLERVIASDLAAYRKALRSKSEKQVSLTSSRVTASIGVHRLIVESTLREFKWKTARNLLSFLTEAYVGQDGEQCEPAALDSARCINAVLSHRPHLDHVTVKEWDRLARFCLSVLPSSHPVQASKNQAALQRRLLYETCKCLRLLTSSPTGPIAGLADSIIKPIIRLLRGADSISNIEGEMFRVIRNIVQAVRVENVILLQELTLPLIQLMLQWWAQVPARSTQVKDDLLDTLLLLQPYVEAAVKTSTTGFKDLIESLFDTLLREYGIMSNKERLKIEDLTFMIRDPENSMQTLIYQLAPGDNESLRNWTYLTLMTSMLHLISANEDESQNGTTDVTSRRKRHHKGSIYDDLVGQSRRADSNGVVVSLQLITFHCQAYDCSATGLMKLMDFTIPYTTNEDHTIASWATLALCSLATRSCATDAIFAETWTTVWSSAQRSINTSATCRTSALLLSVLLDYELIQRSNINDLVSRWQNSLDVLGPSEFEDSSCTLVQFILLYCQHERPSAFLDLARSAVAWCMRTWDPGAMTVTSARPAPSSASTKHLFDLVTTALQSSSVELRYPLPPKSFLSSSWVEYDASMTTLVYLLDLKHYSRVQPQETRSQRWSASRASGSIEQSIHEFLMTICNRHITRILQAYDEVRDEKVVATHEALSYNAVLLLRLVEYLIMDHHCAHNAQHTEAYRNLSSVVFAEMSNPNSSQQMLDSVADVLFTQIACQVQVSPERTELKIVGHDADGLHALFPVAVRLRGTHNVQSTHFDEDEQSDDDDFGVGSNARVTRNTNNTQASNGDHESSNDTNLERASSARLFAKLLEGSDGSLVAFKDELASMEPNEALAGRHLLSQLHDLGISLDDSLVYTILELVGEVVLKSYNEERSEAALQFTLEFLLKSFHCWTVTTNFSLAGLVLDLYDFYILALEQHALSCASQKLFSDLLLQIWQTNESFGQSEDSPPPSVRTSLFSLVESGGVSLNLHQAEKMEIMFSFFTPANHDALFDDLLAKLPIDVDWYEGLAVRLLFLSRLGARWHTLLRKAVYYIFEAACLAPKCLTLAKRAIESITTSHSFHDPMSVFTQFSSQLIFTWMSDRSVADVPFSIFGFSDLQRLVEANVGEFVAQSLLYGNQADFRILQELLGKSEIEFLEMSFPEVFAYAIAHDVTQDADGLKLEEQIRESFSKTQYVNLVRRNLADSLTKLLLSTQLDSGLLKVLEKKDSFGHAFQNLVQMQEFSSNPNPAPPVLQPCFRGRTLNDSLDRIARRAGVKSTDLFHCSILTACIRGLIDAKVPQLGPFHGRNIILRLRLLCALASKTISYRYPADLTIQTLRPLLMDSTCADDAVGLMFFVYKQCQNSPSENKKWLLGSVLHTLSILRLSVKTEVDVLTQDTQRQTTVSHLQKLASWLAQYASSLIDSNDRHFSDFQSMLLACSEAHYPASLQEHTGAFQFLQLLLDDESRSDQMLSKEDRCTLLKFLLQNSEGPNYASSVSLSLTALQSRTLYKLSAGLELSEGILRWLGNMIGTAYSKGGSVAAEEFFADSKKVHSKSTQISSEAIISSKAKLISGMVDQLWNEQLPLASVAETSLRETITQMATDGEVEVLKLLPDYVYEALHNPMAIIHSRTEHTSPMDLEDGSDLPLTCIGDEDIEVWTTRLATRIISRARNSPLMTMLLPVIHRDQTFAHKILAPLVHIFLGSSSDIDIDDRRMWMSGDFKSIFAAATPEAPSSSARLLEVVIYLMDQPMTSEKTRADRFKWLNIDYMDAVRAAVACQRPDTALYILESIPKAAPSAVKGSRRSLLAQESFSKSSAPHEALLSIYDMVTEIDSFYSVERDPSVPSLLKTIDREDDSLKSLLFHSACMDASSINGDPAFSAHGIQTIKSLSRMHLDGLVQQLTKQATLEVGEYETATAQRLYEWDIGTYQNSGTPRGALFNAFQHLHNASSRSAIRGNISTLTAHVVQAVRTASLESETFKDALPTLALLTDIQHLLDSRGPSSLNDLLESHNGHQQLWDAGQQVELHELLSRRRTIFGVLRRNKALQDDMKLSLKDTLLLEVKAILHSLHSPHDTVQPYGALTESIYLSELVHSCGQVGLRIDARAKLELATVLWNLDEQGSSIKMLQEIVARNDLMDQSVEVDRAGVLARLGHQVAQARWERPEEISENYLRPALDSLDQNSSKEAAGKVYYEYASFCDQQLQNPDTIADLKRLKILRDKRSSEYKQLVALQKETPLTNKEARNDVQRSINKVQQWYKLDHGEYQAACKARDGFVEQSLKNYLQALSVSEHYNLHVVRFFALWLEHDQSEIINKAIESILPQVASWKFVTLLNQLMSRLLDNGTSFQALLKQLVSRICSEHPYHSIYHLFASSNTAVGKDDVTANARKSAAVKVATGLKADKRIGPLFSKVWEANSLYNRLANSKVEVPKAPKISIRHIPAANQMNKRVSQLGIPPATIHLELRPAADYTNVPTITRFREEVTIASGISAPKVLTARATDGEQYKQLFKGGNDDLRQDAIMEQVFASVSDMLRNHAATRRRNLHIRTYTVLPLSSTSGIIEFVPNSMPLADYLTLAHERYNPSDLKWEKARQIIRAAQEKSKDERVATYRGVAEKYSPVLRYFFFERFAEPDQWFAKRLAYARSTAAISILGHVLGLGDRHCHNILLDEQSGEVIHIDLGVAFEAGRVLPVPEVVPFRLTRDIVDGLGASGVEGVFRRCSEAVLDALRQDKAAIMTRLDVLRYDPLYSWSVSPLRASRMQTADAQAGGTVLEAAEAERALATVERKLSPALSCRAAVNELIQTACDERNLALLFAGWAAFS